MSEKWKKRLECGAGVVGIVIIFAIMLMGMVLTLELLQWTTAK